MKEDGTKSRDSRQAASPDAQTATTLALLCGSLSESRDVRDLPSARQTRLHIEVDPTCAFAN